MHRYPTAADAVDYRMVSGTEAVDGVRDEGSISRYLAAKAAREREQGWLHAAVSDAFGTSLDIGA